LLGYTLISGQKNAVGSITELTHNMGNKPSIITEEIVEIIPEKKYVTRFTSDGVLNTTTAHFSTTGAGTEITFNSEFHFTGWYKVMVLLKSMFRMETKKTLDNFKKFVTNSVASDVKKK